MPGRPAILVFAGSARRNSLNAKLARAAAAAAEQAGAGVRLLDMRDWPLPLYDGDLEAADGVPARARQLRELVGSHDGLIIASPEYNGFITPMLKNVLDWVSRAPDGNGDGLEPYRDKYALVLSASPGGFGGMRSLALIRQLLTNLGVTVLPEQLAVPRAGDAFGPDGQLADAALAERLQRMTGRLVRTLRALRTA